MDRLAVVRAWLIAGAAFALMVACGTASASGTVPAIIGGDVYYLSTYKTDPTHYPSRSAVCAATAAAWTADSSTTTFTVTNDYYNNTNTCRMNGVYRSNGTSAGNFTQPYSARVDNSCPAPATGPVPNPQGTTCNCPDPNIVDNGVCLNPVPPTVCNAGDIGGTKQDDGTSSAVFEVMTGSGPGAGGMCDQGCQYVGRVTMTATDDAGKTFAWITNPTKTGEACTPVGGPGSVTPISKAAPIDPFSPPGKCKGQVNGVTVEVDCRSTTENTSTTDSSTGGASGAAGTTSSSSTTTVCKDGVCTSTTTTTTKDSSGATVGTESESTSQPKDGYCRANPTAKACAADSDDEEEDSSFAGSCAGFSCSGDAIQCAVAREQHIRNCQMFAQTSITDIGNAAANGASAPGDHPGNSTSIVSMGFAERIDQTNLLGSAQCPADKVMYIASQAFTIPFSSLCGSLQLMGQVLVAICLLASVAIVFRGGK